MTGGMIFTPPYVPIGKWETQFPLFQGYRIGIRFDYPTIDPLCTRSRPRSRARLERRASAGFECSCLSAAFNTPRAITLFTTSIHVMQAGQNLRRFEILPDETIDEWSLEADLPLWKPGKLDGCSGDSLLARKIDGSFPALVSKVSVNLKVLAYALDRLEADVV